MFIIYSPGTSKASLDSPVLSQGEVILMNRSLADLDLKCWAVHAWQMKCRGTDSYDCQGDLPLEQRNGKASLKRSRGTALQHAATLRDISKLNEESMVFK
jgi:hypothetical protein